MSAQPVLLDLFCGAGGATKGYQEAGFCVVGVDCNAQPRYIGDGFLQADAIGFLENFADWNLRLGPFDAIHASPPCQAYSAITSVTGSLADHPELVSPTRELLIKTGLPYVIENVVRAPLVNPVTVCGATYCPTIVDEGTRFIIRRHRLFETNFPVMVEPCTCSPYKGTTLGIYGGGTRQDTRKEANPGGGNTRKANKAQASELMGIDWMTRTEMCQAIPPAYTRHVGEYLLSHLKAEVVA